MPHISYVLHCCLLHVCRQDHRNGSNETREGGLWIGLIRTVDESRRWLCCDHAPHDKVVCHGMYLGCSLPWRSLCNKQAVPQEIHTTNPCHGYVIWEFLSPKNLGGPVVRGLTCSHVSEMCVTLVLDELYFSTLCCDVVVHANTLFSDIPLMKLTHCTWNLSSALTWRLCDVSGRSLSRKVTKVQ